MRARLAVLLAAAPALGLAACQQAEEQASDTRSTTLTVYAGVPLQGPGGPEAEAVANGARLALREAGGRAGDLVVKLVVMDSSTPAAGTWVPEEAAENARRVVRDRTAIAYLGDGPSGATAITLPVLNAAGVAQVSPTSTYTGLTRAADADKGEPDKYYPSGIRTFARPVPADDVQARALLAAMRERDCRRLSVLEDREVAGRGLAAAVARRAQDAGIAVVRRDAHRRDEDPVTEARRIAEDRPDCVVVAAALAEWVPDLFDALHENDPGLALLGSDGLASDAFAATLAPGTQARTVITGPPGIREPRPAVRAFAARYRRAFALAPRTGALYGHEAMRIVLAAIDRAGAKGNDRAAVIRALFELGERRGPLGTYRLTRTGDTSSTAYSRYALRDGRLASPETGRFGPP